MQLRKAERKQAKLKIGIASPTNGGKTYSSLLLGKGLVGDWSKIAVIDTENNSADLYDHLGTFNVLPMEPPYSPDNYIKAIDECLKAGMECVIIDSMSHEWTGAGGALDILNALGGKFTDWSKVTPKHQKFINKILQSNAHFICTSRVKTEWVIEKNDKGKNEPRKAGLKEEQRDGLTYEFTLAFRLNQDHYAMCDKDRTGLFSDRDPFIISEKTGEILRDWASKGKNPDDYFDFRNESHRTWLKSVCIDNKVESEETWKSVAKQMQGLERKPEILQSLILAAGTAPEANQTN